MLLHCRQRDRRQAHSNCSPKHKLNQRETLYAFHVSSFHKIHYLRDYYLGRNVTTLIDPAISMSLLTTMLFPIVPIVPPLAEIPVPFPFTEQ